MAATFEDILAGFMVLVLAATYMTIVGVALFHPDKQRRADALRVLSMHRLTKAVNRRKK